MQSPLRVLVRLGNLLLFVLCCFLVADVANEVSAGLLRPGAGPTRLAGEMAPAPRPAPSWAERETILDRNLFGSSLVAAVPIEPEEEEELEKTELPLELAGTLASDARGTRMASIWNAERREYQVLRPGDRLEHHPRVQLARVERGRVILRNGDELEELLLEDRERKLRPRRQAMTTLRKARKERIEKLRRARARRNR